MWQWLQRLFGGGAPPANADPALIDRLVEIASTRIKMADNYRYRLAPLVAHACEQIREFEEKLPAPILLAPENWRRSPILNHAFANPDRMSELVNASEGVREWFDAHPLADSAFAVLSMAHDVEQRYGMEESNGQVRQDVLQEVLVLRDHRFGPPTATADELARQARRLVLEELAHHAARRIEGLQTDRDHLESELNTLRIALRLGGSVDPIDASPMQRHRLQRIAYLTDELAATRKALDPEQQLGVLAAALRNPQGQLRFTETRLLVDPFGVLRDSENSREVELVEIEIIADTPLRCAMQPVEIPRRLLQFEDRAREVGIFGKLTF